ncbi:MAG: type II toxin-antitoxin system VapB family antitoxin [Phycisphaeraceae bacterium]
MRTTVNLDDALLEQAARLTGVSNKTALVNKALEVLVARESARALARLGGSQPEMKEIPRRRSAS